MKRINLKAWELVGCKVRLVYEDNDIVYIHKSDFDRAFGPIISADKNDVLRDYSIQ